MLKLKTITIKNFMSVGAVTQSLDFESSDLVLVLGENIDLGGNSARNGVGKCVCADTMVTVRDTRTGEIKQVTMEELYKNNE